MRKKIWNTTVLNQVSEVMKTAKSYREAVLRLDKEYGFKTNWGTLEAVTSREKISRPYMEWGGNRSLRDESK